MGPPVAAAAAEGPAAGRPVAASRALGARPRLHRALAARPGVVTPGPAAAEADSQVLGIGCSGVQGESSGCSSKSRWCSQLVRWLGEATPRSPHLLARLPAALPVPAEASQPAIRRRPGLAQPQLLEFDASCRRPSGRPTPQRLASSDGMRRVHTHTRLAAARRCQEPLNARDAFATTMDRPRPPASSSRSSTRPPVGQSVACHMAHRPPARTSTGCGLRPVSGSTMTPSPR